LKALLSNLYTLQKKFTISVSFVPGIIFIVIAWSIKLMEVATGYSLSFLGLYPQRFQGLLGVFTAPFLHGSFEHLISNSFPMLFLTALVFQLYPRLAWSLSGWLLIATGFWTWCFARESYHIGASGLVYGFAAFLFFAGIWRGKRAEWGISFLIMLLYAGMLAGLVPKDDHISWESHLSGFLAGASYAYFSRKWEGDNYSLENTKEEENTYQEALILTEIYYKKNAEDSPQQVYSSKKTK